MSKEYYQMGWTLDDNYEEDYFCSRDNHRYFIKKNTTPMIATLSAEGIVPTLRWTRRMSNGDVLIAQDFENGRTLDTKDMIDPRIPEILRKVHSSPKLKRIMQALHAINYLENNLPEDKIEYTPCHTDLHKDNWLLSDKGKLFLVDWEHAILGDPAIDISFILYRYIPQNMWGKWLEIYGQEPTLKYRNRLKWYITLQTVIMIVWFHEKKLFSDMNNWLVFLDKIFNEYI